MNKEWVFLGRRETDLISVTYESRAANLRGPQGACHPQMLEISLLEQGGEHAIVGGRESSQSAGQYNMITPGVEHSSWTADAPAVEMNIHLTRGLIDRVAADLNINLGGHDWPSDNFAIPKEMMGILSALKHELSEAPQPMMLDALAHYMAGLLLRRHFAKSEKGEAESPPTRLRQAEDLMRSTPAEHFTIDQLAATANMSRYHFVRAFKQHYGVPPYTYLIQLRVERAANLMCTTELPLTTIAFDLGFGSSGRLSEAFKRVHGIPPSRWRSAQKRQNRPAARSGKRSDNIREAKSR